MIYSIKKNKIKKKEFKILRVYNIIKRTKNILSYKYMILQLILSNNQFLLKHSML